MQGSHIQMNWILKTLITVTRRAFHRLLGKQQKTSLPSRKGCSSSQLILHQSVGKLTKCQNNTSALFHSWIGLSQLSPFSVFQILKHTFRFKSELFCKFEMTYFNLTPCFTLIRQFYLFIRKAELEKESLRSPKGQFYPKGQTTG